MAGTTLTTNRDSQLINKARDQNISSLHNAAGTGGNGNVDVSLSEATNFVRRLNIVIKHACPDCLAIIKDVLFDEKEPTARTNENSDVLRRGVQ